MFSTEKSQLLISRRNSLKLLISQSKFSDPRKFTFRYQQFEITRVERHVSKLYSLIKEGVREISALKYQELTVSVGLLKQLCENWTKSTHADRLIKSVSYDLGNAFL